MISSRPMRILCQANSNCEDRCELALWSVRLSAFLFILLLFSSILSILSAVPAIWLRVLKTVANEVNYFFNETTAFRVIRNA